jgi:phosphomannomutase
MSDGFMLSPGLDFNPTIAQSPMQGDRNAALRHRRRDRRDKVMRRMGTLDCFKAYDIRGRLGAELNEGIARDVGRAFAQVLRARSVVLGRDCRLSSEGLAAAVADGLMAEGVEVLDLGLSGTEEMYFATSHLGADGGITVTASHNPMDYNGMKMVGRGSAPLAGQTGLGVIRAVAEARDFGPLRRGGRITPAPEARAAYVARVLSFVDVAAFRPMRVLVNAGNGAAGPTFDAIAAALAQAGAPLSFSRINHEPDGTFPIGIPNPMLAENQPVTARAVRAVGADLAVAWDGDFDRCFLFDHEGAFVPGEYVVGLLAEVFLDHEPGAGIVHDPRVVWNTQEIVARKGGRAIASRTGHAFLKAALRKTGAAYGGEMSAHHYFRDFAACDSGMIPWLMVLEHLSRKDESLAQVLADRRALFPSSGEINFRLADPAAAIAAVQVAYAPVAHDTEAIDGLGMSFAQWRFNLRASNTEPLLRLNVEGRGNPDLVAEKAGELGDLIRKAGGAV